MATKAGSKPSRPRQRPKNTHTAKSSGKRQPKSMRQERKAREREAQEREAIASAEAAETPSVAPTPTPVPVPVPVPTVPRQTKPATTPTQRRAAQNLLDALGGPEYVIPRLQASGDKKALRLAEIMQARDFESTSFYFKLKSVGMPVTQFTELLLDVNQASAIARLITGVDHVAEDIMSKAVDQFEPHRQCLTSGRVLRELEDGTLVPTDVECFDCQGSGYLLKSAEREWVELYLELVRMRKNAPMVAINNSRQVLNQQMNVYGDLASPDGAPSIDSIIKRADDQMLTASADHRLTDGSERVPDFARGMPEDDREVETAEMTEMVEVVEAEVVVADAVSV